MANRERKTETLNLRVSASFKKRVTEEARLQKRSIANYVEVVVTEYWDFEAKKKLDK